MHVHDLQATLLHQFGVDHENDLVKPKAEGLDLPDVSGEVKHDIFIKLI